ncbi:High-affinity nickel-transporter [Bosea sp. LC85]|uniref:nickel/cobalt efflux transporter n=1 Tax=Bosea sp. LC85 TaxID=1502851 RepID=UPI0004E360D9|nr:nickel/cobalt efflux transporter [Bosea sp. LC85]KFC64628.1 High-affinity nickel-transporter [Bosea sp. LC85]
MPSFADLIQQSSAHAWMFIPSAILLGALHGLEPGHSKTMMAAFIVAVRGTVTQAVLLGLAATVSHTIIVWGIAIGGMYLWQGVAPETFEPYLQLVSAVVIVAMALWMLRRTWKDQQRAEAAAGDHGHDHGHHHDHEQHHGHDHGHGHDEHGHGAEIRRIDTGHGVVAVEVFEDGVPPRWRIRTERGKTWPAKAISIVTERPDGTRQSFSFVDRVDYVESVEEIPEPHQFMARISLGHKGHSHDYDLSFVEDHAHGHDHMHEELRGLDVATGGYQDAHELAHANDIRRRFADRNVTTWQIVLFGLTGGLIPCPAAITVLLLCLQLKEFTLGFTLVLCFSIGLAITLVTVGAAAALSVRHATERWSWFSTFARRAPYFSGILLVGVGLYVGLHGWMGLSAQAPRAAQAALAQPFGG